MKRFLMVGICSLLLGCGAPEPPPVNVVPTISPLFSASAPTLTPVPNPPTAIRPTATIDTVARLRATPTATGNDERIAEIPILDRQLDSNWTFANSWGVRVNSQITVPQQAIAASLSVTPEDETGALFLSVLPTTRAAYERPRSLGFSIWLNSGEETMYPEDLAITILGSNALRHWAADDNSVEALGVVDEENPKFSRTRLYFLDINQPVPPRTSFEVVIWIDDREFDPVYNYVTGLQIVHDTTLKHTYYVERVLLLVER
jgi:hypothetical protein